MRRPTSIAIAAVLLAAAWLLPHVRHRLIQDVITWDAVPSEPALWPRGDGPGLPAASRVRVVLIDGLSADTARALPTWSALCKRGVDLTVDVGFPTISLPVEAALWTGLTQQQTGIVFRSDHPIEPPLANSIPAQVPDSRAIAENHGYIVRSLGFHQVESDDKAWEQHAQDAVAAGGRLVFVHVLRVDTAGHKHGHDSPEYKLAASEADAILGHLVAAAPDARWFVLSDHGHLPGGGHGGEERAVRQVSGCIVGPGITPAKGPLVHVVDVARALADSTGTTLPAGSLARPLAVAIAAPLGADQSIPPTALEPGAVATVALVLGALLGAWGARRWWLGPWWFAVACASLVLVRGVPTLSMPMVFAPAGRAMYLTWLPALAIAAVTTWFGLGKTTLPRVIVAQLALPLGALVASLIVTGAWRSLLGQDVAPVVPRFTAWMSPLLMILAHGMAAVALGVLGRLARSAFGRRPPPEPPRSAPAGA